MSSAQPSQPSPPPRVTLAWLREAPPTVNVTTAARALGIRRATAYEAIARGQAPFRVITVGNSRMPVPTAELIALLEARERAA